jgi:hypothetical protein
VCLSSKLDQDTAHTLQVYSQKISSHWKLVNNNNNKNNNKGAKYGLHLNPSKCEAITLNGTSSHHTLRNYQQFTPKTATLLGAPLSKEQAMDECLTARYNDLSRAIERLKSISAYDALLLLKNSLSAPKLQHTLRTAFCDGHHILSKFDDKLRSALGIVCNVTLTDQQWLQASLPVCAGGLGIRRVSSLATSAFLASAAGTRELQDRLLRQTADSTDEEVDLCLTSRFNKLQSPSPSGSAAHKQRAWDKLVVDMEYHNLLSSYTDPNHRARLLASAAPHSGDWLHALPIAACGLHLDDEAVRVAVGLRLGCALCQSHTCRCGTTVDTLGSHAWICKRNAGRSQRHAFINELICRALARADIPAVKEPHGLARNDGKRPDGLTLVPWQSGRSATWDVTVTDTLAASYLNLSVSNAASAAEAAASRKTTKYRALSENYHFFPLAIETLGPIAATSQLFISEIGRRTTMRTADPRETTFLYQRISVAIQRFNAVCLTNTFTGLEPSA